MDSVQADEFDPPHSGGRILLLLDGLDEIASADEREALLEGIRVLCARPAGRGLCAANQRA